LKLDDLPTDRCDFIIVGDTHIHKSFTKESCVIFSPGSTELCESSEDPDKYVFVINTDNTYYSEKLITRNVVYLSFSTKEDVDTFLENLKTNPIKDSLVFSEIENDIAYRFKEIEDCLSKSG
ncbi:hypothetical protein V6O07_13950, partial [Arthrospira platensis SPKY2]